MRFVSVFFFFFQAEDGIRDADVTGVQTCALPIWPGTRIPRPHRITIRFGEPLDFQRYVGMDGAPVIRRAITDEIMYAILELSGQEYVDSYQERPAA